VVGDEVGRGWLIKGRYEIGWSKMQASSSVLVASQCPLAWDFTVPDTLAQPYLPINSATRSCEATDTAASIKTTKHAHLATIYAHSYPTCIGNLRILESSDQANKAVRPRLSSRGHVTVHQLGMSQFQTRLLSRTCPTQRSAQDL
jgi:hypothetical protein